MTQALRCCCVAMLLAAFGLVPLASATPCLHLQAAAHQAHTDCHNATPVAPASVVADCFSLKAPLPKPLLLPQPELAATLPQPATLTFFSVAKSQPTFTLQNPPPPDVLALSARRRI